MQALTLLHSCSRAYKRRFLYCRSYYSKDGEDKEFLKLTYMKDKIILWLIKQLSNKPGIEWFDDKETLERVITFRIPIYYGQDKLTEIKDHMDKIITILK